MSTRFPILPGVSHGFTPAQVAALRPVQGPPVPVSQAPGARPPGAPPAGAPPRLPSLGGAQPYDPPPAVQIDPPPMQALNVGSDGEAATTMVTPVGSQPVLVYTTARRWRACDVYVSCSNAIFQAGRIISILVYAIGDQGRTLVASGRIGNFNPDILTPKTMVPTWVVAARAQASRFEVQLQSNFNMPVGGEQFAVTAIASDEADSPPAGIGMIPILDQASAGPIRVSGPLNVGAPSQELVKIIAANGAAAAARYVHVFDAPPTGAMPTTPVLSYGMPAGGGISVEVDYRRFVRGVAIAASSTPVAYTAAADCALRGFIR